MLLISCKIGATRLVPHEVYSPYSHGFKL